jgi:hypothetical protein
MLGGKVGLGASFVADIRVGSFAALLVAIATNSRLSVS